MSNALYRVPHNTAPSSPPLMPDGSLSARPSICSTKYHTNWLYHLLEAPPTTRRGYAGRVDLPPQGLAELLSHPAAVAAPRRSCGVREGGRWRGNTNSLPQLARQLLLLKSRFQGRRGF
jgi:hypothetical protein